MTRSVPSPGDHAWLPAPPLSLFARPLMALALRAGRLARRLAARHLAEPAPAPSRARTPSAADRAHAACLWFIALYEALAGDFAYLPRETPRAPPHRAQPAPNSAPNPAPAAEPPSAARRQAAWHRRERRRIRQSFGRDSIGEIIRRLCQSIGVGPDHPSYPAELAAIDVTPRQWIKDLFQARLAAITARHAITPDDLLPQDIILAALGPTLRPPRRLKPPWLGPAP